MNKTEREAREVHVFARWMDRIDKSGHVYPEGKRPTGLAEMLGVHLQPLGNPFIAARLLGIHEESGAALYGLYRETRTAWLKLEDLDHWEPHV